MSRRNGVGIGIRESWNGRGWWIVRHKLWSHHDRTKDWLFWLLVWKNCWISSSSKWCVRYGYLIPLETNSLTHVDRWLVKMKHIMAWIIPFCLPCFSCSPAIFKHFQATFHRSHRFKPHPRTRCLKGQRRPLVSNAGCAVSDGWSGNGSGMTWPYHVSQKQITTDILSLCLYVYIYIIIYIYACYSMRKTETSSWTSSEEAGRWQKVPSR